MPEMGVTSWRRLLLSFYAIFTFLLMPTLAEPVQFCKFGDPARPNEDVDFCLGLTTWRNATTGAHDVYLTFSHTRRQSSAKGWTAVGTGDEMAGSLMFIVYGDPSSGEKPIVSIRGATGHHQPTLLTQAQMGGGDLRVLRSDWMRHKSSQPGGTVTAMVSAVCFSCTLWPGTGALSATATSQPWIWAWNKAQEFDVYTYDAHLQMHAHHAGNGGWGRFYVNMARAESTSTYLPSVPIIRPDIEALGASESPDLFASGGITGYITSHPALRAHGLLMALAFLLLFPAGVFAMRSGSSRAFKYHWIIQAAASAAMAGGVAAGLTLQHKIDTAHQVLGLSLASALGIQSYLGWKHHVDFVRIRRRTWISHAHIWTGRSVMLGGYVNLVLGLILRGYSRLHVGLVVLFMVMQSLAMIVWVWRQAKRAAAQGRIAKYKSLEEDSGEQACFTIASPDDTDDEEEDAESSGTVAEKEKWDAQENERLV
jgi:hypothetical protein